MPPLLSKIDSLSSIKFLLFRPHNVFNSTNVLWMTIWEHRNSVWSSINLETKPSSNIYGAKLILSNWHLIVIVLPYQAQLCSSYPRLSVAEGATALCGIHQPSFFNKLKPITRAGIKWKERVTVTNGGRQLNIQHFPLIAKTHEPMHFVGQACQWTNNHQLKHQLSFLYPSNHFQIASEIGLTIANNYWFWQITNN